MYYADYPMLESIGSQSVTLDAVGGISQHGNVNISLDAGSGIHDPIRVLRLDQGTLNARLKSSVLATDIPVFVETTTSVASWPGGLGIIPEFHIGQECFQALSVDAGVAPFGFSNVTRAMGGTKKQSHIVQSDIGSYPLITPFARSWRGRRATLSYAPTGSATYTEYASGFLTGPPTLSDDGLMLYLTIAPLTSILDMELGTYSTTTLVDGWHYFTLGRGDSIYRQDHVAQGDLWSATCSAGALTLQPDIVVDYDTILEGADFSAVLASGLRPHVMVYNNSGWDSDGETAASATVGSPCTITLDENLPFAVDPGATILNADSFDWSSISIPQGLQKWPQIAVDTINANWHQTVVTPGAVVSWTDWAITDNGGDVGWNLLHRRTSTLPGHKVDSRFRPNWEFARQTRGVPSTLDLSPSTQLWYGLQLCSKDAVWYDSRDEGDGIIALGSKTWTFDQLVTKIEVLPVFTQRSEATAIRGPASAYYQTGEPVFLAVDDVFRGTMPSQAWVRVAWEQGGEDLVTYARISSVAPVLDPVDGVTVLGYLYTLAAGSEYRVRSFGNWDGKTCTISAVPMIRGGLSADVYTALMMSGSGDTVYASDGTDNTQPFGCGLDSSEVFLNGIRQNPGGTWTFDFTEAFKLRDILDPMLKADGLILRQEGLHRLKLSTSPIGAPGLPVTLISDADIAAAGAVRTVTDDNVICETQISYSYYDCKPTGKGRIIDQSAVNDAGGDVGSPLKLELRGFVPGSVSDAEVYLRDISTGILSRLSQSRRVWTVTLAWPPPEGLYVGSSVEVDLVGAVSLDGTRGIGSTSGSGRAIGRVTSIIQAPDAVQTTLTITGWAGSGAGWAPGSFVASVTSPTVFVVSAGDGVWFAKPDTIECIQAGNYSGRVTRTISAVSGDTITTTAAHLLSAGDSIRTVPPAAGFCVVGPTTGQTWL